MMVESLNLKNKEIVELKAKVEYLKGRVDNINETGFIKKVSALLSENTKLNLRTQEIEKLSQGLEDRTRKVVELQYHNEIERLLKENELIQRKFKEFQNILVTVTKDETKHSVSTLLTELKVRSSDILQKNI